jgi:3-oxoacyl-(acyl-carrier-protein) synthase
MVCINAIGMISPQNSLPGDVFLQPVIGYQADYLKCKEPVYREFIEPLAARRMSRLIKMGITAAQMCLKDNETGTGLQRDGSKLDAIITGTGLGSVEDTEKILGNLTQEEKFLNPTPFIQSTYNTISSQIAINLKCHNYNSTYVHRTLSFESSLLDAILQIEEGSAQTVLAGGIDEMTMNHLQITRRIGLWKRDPVQNLKLREINTAGALAGEGAGYFLLEASRNEHTYARMNGVDIAFQPTSTFDPVPWIKDFLNRNHLKPSDVDLLLSGKNGDNRFDPYYDSVAASLFPGKPLGWYKHLCGEYHTASAFGLFVASNLIKMQACPEVLRDNELLPGSLNHILIYNHFRKTDHSLILLSNP